MSDFTVEEIDPRELRPHPQNWRRHPERQRNALQASLKEFGFVTGPIWNKRTGNLVDGHLRVEEAIAMGRQSIPVNVIDLSPSDEKRLLRLFDPITGMAETDEGSLAELIAEIGDPDLEALLEPMTTPALAPEEFPEYDESIDTEHRCPKCGYEWSGKAG